MQIYLDNSASTPLDPHVRNALRHWNASSFGNASSIHFAGRKIKNKLEQVRLLLAEQLSCKSKEMVFTSGGTESNNLALIGAALANRHKGNHLIVSAVEHPSLIQSARYLEKIGFEIDYVKPDRQGLIRAGAVKKFISKKTILVSVMYINNETGAVFPVQEIGALCRAYNILMHCDAVQAFAKINISLNELAIDLMSFSAHKIYGPAGSGALFIREGTQIDPLIVGGGQEANRRAGTENAMGITGFGAALEILPQSLHFYEQAAELQRQFETRVKQAVPQAVIIAEENRRSPYISLISFPGISNDTLLMALDMAGVAASAGSACSSGSISRSHVLQAMALPETVMDGAVRFSFSKFTNSSEINEAAGKLIQIVNGLYKK